MVLFWDSVLTAVNGVIEEKLKIELIKKFLDIEINCRNTNINNGF